MGKIYHSENCFSQENRGLLYDLLKKRTMSCSNHLLYNYDYREEILELVETFLEVQRDNRYTVDESVLYNILFPWGDTFDIICYDKHNLWILDERLMYQKFMFSLANQLGEDPITEERDYPLYDVTFAYGEPKGNGHYNSITMLLFTRPKGKITYLELNEVILDQILQIRTGKAEDCDGFIKADENTPLLFYCVCDESSFQDLKINVLISGYSKTQGQTLLRFTPQNNIAIEILTYQVLLDRATLRNKILLDRLELE